MKKSWLPFLGLAALGAVGYYLWKQKSAKTALAGGSSGGGGGGVSRSVAPVPLADNTDQTSLLSKILGVARNVLGGTGGAASGATISGNLPSLTGLFKSIFGGGSSSSSPNLVTPEAALYKYDASTGNYYDPADPGLQYNDPYGSVMVTALPFGYTPGATPLLDVSAVGNYQTVDTAPIDYGGELMSQDFGSSFDYAGEASL